MTSGNGQNAPTVTGSTPQNGEIHHQAVVQPQILTHLIEGFVIQEGADPFPVEHPSFSIETVRKQPVTSEMDSHDLKAWSDEPMLTCELCGRVDFAYIFKRSKRFCSTVCAKRYNVGCTKRMGLFPNRRTATENLKRHKAVNGNAKNVGMENKMAPLSVQSPVTVSPHPHMPSPGRPIDCFLPGDPTKWNVENVYLFICSLSGGLDIAEEFRSQEIDGQALLLLKEDHLMGTMNIKLGPALKLFAQISMLKD